MQFHYEKADDKWWQAALTVEGKLADFDVTYAGAYMKRQIEGEFDYSNYSYFYDALSGYAVFWYDNDFNQIEPTQYIVSDDRFTKQSHELRFTSPADRPIRLSPACSTSDSSTRSSRTTSSTICPTISAELRPHLRPWPSA